MYSTHIQPLTRTRIVGMINNPAKLQKIIHIYKIYVHFFIILVLFLYKITTRRLLAPRSDYVI